MSRPGPTPIEARDPATTFRNFKLDSVRGIAAVCVAFHHAVHLADPTLAHRVLMPPLSELAWPDLWLRLLLSCFNGGVAVYVFFILSGAVLMNSLLREASLDLRAALRFLGRRVLRIYPALVVAIVFCAVLTHLYTPPEVDGPFGLADVLSNSLLLSHVVNGATWTLQSEMLMVPFLFLLALAWRSFGMVALVAYLAWSEAYLFVPPPFGGFYLNTALLAFGLGALAMTPLAGTAVARLPRGVTAACFAGVVLARFYHPLSDAFGLLLIFWLAAAGIALLFHDRRADHPLEAPLPRFFGRISYSFYLYHVPAVFAVFSAVRFMWPGGLADHPLLVGIFTGVAGTALTIPFALASEIHVERPGIRLAHRLFPGRPRQVAPEPAGFGGGAPRPQGEERALADEPSP